MNPRPLEGVRVLDLSRLLPGPFATMVLSDLGARVDKIEDPAGGDYLRAMPPQVGGMSTAFHLLNRNKRSAVIDLKQAAGRELLLRLLPHYDVLLETFRPGVMARMGLGYERLQEVHPGLVYCAITGYGQDGPLAARAGHDLNYIGRAGVLALTGPASGPPQAPGVQMADIGGGALYAVTTILAALYARRETGRGQMIDVSMCEGSLSFALYGLSLWFGNLLVGHGQDALMGGIAPYDTYATRDGKAITVAALEPKFFIAFCQGTGLEPEMQALMPGPHQAEWKAKIAAKIREKTRDEWVAFGEANDCCVEPVLEPHELPDDPQHQARGVFFNGPAGEETMRMFRTPIGKPDEVRPAPRQGEHTDKVLAEAGLSESELASLRAASVIR